MKGEPLRLQMATRFPFDPEVHLQISAARPTPARIRVRVPSWATREMTVYVNGKPVTTGKPGSYVVLTTFGQREIMRGSLCPRRSARCDIRE